MYVQEKTEYIGFNPIHSCRHPLGSWDVFTAVKRGEGREDYCAAHYGGAEASQSFIENLLPRELGDM